MGWIAGWRHKEKEEAEFEDEYVNYGYANTMLRKELEWLAVDFHDERGNQAMSAAKQLYDISGGHGRSDEFMIGEYIYFIRKLPNAVKVTDEKYGDR